MEENVFTINNRLQKGEITTEQAKKELLVLFDVVGQSEQLKCLMDDDKPNCNCELNHCLKKGW